MSRFFGFRVIQRNTRSGESLIYQILIHEKRNDLHAIAIVNKNLVNRTVSVSLENELVPLNGRIGVLACLVKGAGC